MPVLATGSGLGWLSSRFSCFYVVLKLHISLWQSFATFSEHGFGLVISVMLKSYHGSGGDAILLTTLLFHVRRGRFSDRLQWWSVQRVDLENWLLIVLTMFILSCLSTVPQKPTTVANKNGGRMMTSD